MAQRSIVHQIRRATQKRYSAEEKIRIVLEAIIEVVVGPQAHAACISGCINAVRQDGAAE